MNIQWNTGAFVLCVEGNEESIGTQVLRNQWKK